MVESEARLRFRFSLAELSGALADLGILLPLALALVSLNKMSATSAFVGFGLAYLLNAWVYRLPIPVQPLKSFAATALALQLSLTVIVAGAWWMALTFLLLALTDAPRLIVKLFPRPVIRGIQLGLGLLLVRSAWNLLNQPSLMWNGALSFGSWRVDWTILLSTGAVLVLGILLWVRRDWAALGVIGFGMLAAVFHNGLPPVRLALALPEPVGLPRPPDIWMAFGTLVLPQIPLSLANSVYATADTAQQYFQSGANHVTPRRLLSTMGMSNLAVAFLGGIPVCHGCGGLTAHYRLGARTGGAPLMLGACFLLLGLLGGGMLIPLIELIPFSTLGVLLAYVGIQHALLVKDLHGWREWSPALVVAATALYTQNLATGFVLGAAVYFAIQGSGAIRKIRV